MSKKQVVFEGQNNLSQAINSIRNEISSLEGVITDFNRKQIDSSKETIEGFEKQKIAVKQYKEELSKSQVKSQFEEGGGNSSNQNQSSLFQGKGVSELGSLKALEEIAQNTGDIQEILMKWMKDVDDQDDEDDSQSKEQNMDLIRTIRGKDDTVGDQGAEGEGGESDKGGSSLGQKVESASNKAAGIGVQRNELYMVAAVVGMIPLIGGALSALGNKAFSLVESFEKGRAATAGLYQGSISAGRGVVLGLNRAEYLQQAAGIMPSIGYGANMGDRVYDVMATQKGTGVSQGELTNLMKLQRGNNGEEYMSTLNNIVSGMQAIGIGDKNDLTLLGEVLQINNTIAQEQLTRLGEIDMGVNTRMIAAIGEMGSKDLFKNPEVLRNLVSLIDQGLRQSATPQIEALQYQVLSKISPGSSLLELEEMKEKGMSQKGYLSGFLKELKSISGSDEEYIRNIKNVFGTSINVAREFLEGDLSEDEMQAKIAGTEDIDLKGRKRSGQMSVATANIDNKFIKLGTRLTKILAPLSTKAIEALEKLTDFATSSESEHKTANKLKGMSSEFKTAVAQFMEAVKMFKKAEKDGKIDNSAQAIFNSSMDLLKRRAEKERGTTYYPADSQGTGYVMDVWDLAIQRLIKKYPKMNEIYSK